MRCGESAHDCVVQHWLGCLSGVTGSGKQFAARCPACSSSGQSLSITIKGTAILVRCHRVPRCGQAAIRAALMDAGIRCFPGTGPPRTPATRFYEDAGALLEEDISAGAFRLRMAAMRWDMSMEDAAEKLGISRSARYRFMAPQSQKWDGTAGHEDARPSPKSGTHE